MTQLEGQRGVRALVLPCQAQTQRFTVCLVVLQLWTHPQRTLQQHVTLCYIKLSSWRRHFNKQMCCNLTFHQAISESDSLLSLWLGLWAQPSHLLAVWLWRQEPQAKKTYTFTWLKLVSDPRIISDLVQSQCHITDVYSQHTLKMPPFCQAIFSMVSPRIWVWSIPREETPHTHGRLLTQWTETKHTL